MSLLPEGTALGRLHLLETYDYYDGPRLFSARNASGTTFFVFWADASAEADIWFYAPVSEDRLADLREGVLTIRNGFLHAEDGFVYRVKQMKGTGAAAVEVVGLGDIPQDCLPPEDDSISLQHLPALAHAVPAQEAPRATGWLLRKALQRIKISRTKGDLPPAVQTVTAVLDSWVQLFQGVAEHQGSRGEMLPVSAVPGSFVFDVAIGNPAAAAAAFRQLVELFRRKLPSGALEKLIADGKIPPSSYRALLDAVRLGDVEVRVTMADGHGESEIVLGPERSAALQLQSAKAARSRLQGDQIPQADEVQRVFRLLELASKGREVTAEQLDVTPRQVAYYKHAGRVLGYLDDANEPTSAGSQLIRLDPGQRLISAAMHYEGADCGATWIAWSEVASLAEVDANTAEEFLVDVSNLSESTAFRRAKTLRSWLAAVLPYHYTRWFKGLPPEGGT